MALNYLSPGEGISAARMNSLIDEVEDIVHVCLSGKSPIAFGLGYNAGLVCIFGDKSKRKILANDTSHSYSGQVFRDIAATLSLVTQDEDNYIYYFTSPTVEQFEQVLAMFEGTATPSGSPSLFNFCLETMLATAAFPAAAEGYLGIYDEHSDPAKRRIFEHQHDLAVADIVFEGYSDTTFNWPASWGKFGCLRIHNLDLKTLRVNFFDGTRLDIPRLECRTVRLLGAELGKRTAVEVSGRYLWRFRSGDAPILESHYAPQDGVHGTYGANPLCSLSAIVAWLNAVGQFTHSDPRVKWDASALYASTFGIPSDEQCVARYSLHAGSFLSLIEQPDGSWLPIEDSLRWVGNRIASNTLVAEPDGRGVAFVSNGASFGHDVIPITTNMLGGVPVEVTEDGVSCQPIGGLERYSRRITSSTYTRTESWIIPDTSGLGNATIQETEPLEITVAGPAELFPDTSGRTVFNLLLGDCKAFGLTNGSVPETIYTEFSDRSIAFNGLALWMTWETREPLDLMNGEMLSLGFGEWEITSDRKFVSRFAASIARVAVDALERDAHTLSPGRLTRKVSDGFGFVLNGTNFVHTEHADFYRDDNARLNGADYRWVEPRYSEIELKHHDFVEASGVVNGRVLRGQTTATSRALRVGRQGTWAANREDILAGKLELEEKRQLVRMPGCVEHFNLLVERLTSIVAIAPAQFDALVYYGTWLQESRPTGYHSAREWGRVDNLTLAPPDDLLVTGRPLPATEFITSALADTSRYRVNPQNPFDLRETSLSEQTLQAFGFGSVADWNAYRYVTIDDVKNLSEQFGIYCSIERLMRPLRYQDANYGVHSLWHTASEANAIRYSPLNSELTHLSVNVFVEPITLLPGTPESLVDYNRSRWGSMSGPTFAETCRALVWERASYAPPMPDGWTSRNETKWATYPVPHFRYESIAQDDWIGEWYEPYVPKVLIEKPPGVSPDVIDVALLSSENSSLFIDPPKLQEMVGSGLDEWGDRTAMVFRPFPRVAVFRT